MTTEQILAQIEALNIVVSVHRWNESYMKPNNWSVTLLYDQNGTKLETMRRAELFKDALALAWSEFDRIANKGLPLARLAAPIEHHQDDADQEYAERRRAEEDEIPF